MKCKQCGSDVSSFDVTCPACGAVLAQAPAPPVQTPSVEASPDAPQPPPRKRSGGAGSIVMWVLLLIVFVVAGGVYSATQRMGADSQTATLAGDQAARLMNIQKDKAECDAMLAMVQQATQSENSQDFKSAISSAEEGLSHQTGCTMDSGKAFGGVLLSVKAVSEHFLSRGDATGDMNAADILLQECEAETAPADATDVRNCTNWLGTDRMYLQRWQDGG
jgi:hypothetical protein